MGNGFKRTIAALQEQEALNPGKKLFGIMIETSARAGSKHPQTRAGLHRATDRNEAELDASIFFSKLQGGKPKISKDGRTFDYGKEGVITILDIWETTADDFFAERLPEIHFLADAGK